MRLLAKIHDPPLTVHLHDPERGRGFPRHWLDRNRHVRATRSVLFDKGAVIHAIEVVARQDQHLVGPARQKMPELLAHRIGRALVPIDAVLGLLGSQDLDKAIRKRIKAVRRADVAVQRSGIELGQGEDAVDPRMQTIADGNVD